MDNTTDFSIVDLHGFVLNTTTLNTGYGSGIVVDGAGFLLNSQINDFAKPGVPNVYGVTGSAAMHCTRQFHRFRKHDPDGLPPRRPVMLTNSGRPGA